MKRPILTHQEQNTQREHTYSITVKGTQDGQSTRDPIGYSNYNQAWENNLWLRLENTGNQTVTNPWIVVNGKRDWRSLEHILAEVLDEDMDDRQKARAIWEFARSHRYHFTTGDDEVKDTVKMLNSYGYTLCWDEAYTVSNLWQAAGLKIRRGLPHGHCTTEVYYDGAYHLLDSDEHLLVLDRDNQTIAGEAEIADDPDLIKRAHTYGVLSPQSRSTSEGAAALFTYRGPRSGTRPLIGGHRMDMDLRPREAIIWTWSQFDAGFHRRKPPRWSNGQLEFTPLLDEDFAQWAESAINIESAANKLSAQDPTAPSQLIYRMESPYVMVGGRCQTSAATKVSLSFDGKTWQDCPQQESDENTYELTPCFKQKDIATYSYFIRLAGTNFSLDTVKFITDLQMAPLALPALELGENTIVYQDENPGPRQVEITHAWQERDDSVVPPSPVPIFPQPESTVKNTAFSFSWQPVAIALDYHFQLGQTAGFKHCLSPTFDKLVSKTPSAGKAEWQIPAEGLLNPGQTYYWRLRSRNKDGLWGPWSPDWAFTPKGPGVPQNLRLEQIGEQRSLVLKWDPSLLGEPASTYQIFAANEFGFSANCTAYLANTGAKEPSQYPANLIGTTSDTEMVVVDESLAEGQGNFSHYRVVALDKDQVTSGPSAQVAAPCPYIYSQPPVEIEAGQDSSYLIKTLFSLGQLRSVSQGPNRYFSAMRDGDCPNFELDEGPAWLTLDEDTGLLSASPGLEDLGTHTVTVRANNGRGATEVQGFDLQVIAGI